MMTFDPVAESLADACAEQARQWLESQSNIVAVVENMPVLEVGIYAGIYGTIRHLVDIGLLED